MFSSRLGVAAAGVVAALEEEAEVAAAVAGRIFSIIFQSPHFLAQHMQELWVQEEREARMPQRPRLPVPGA